MPENGESLPVSALFGGPQGEFSRALFIDRRTAVRAQCSACVLGGVPEWSKGTDCKSVGSAFGGSNPPPSTNSVCWGMSITDSERPRVTRVVEWRGCRHSAEPRRLQRSDAGWKGIPADAGAGQRWILSLPDCRCGMSSELLSGGPRRTPATTSAAVTRR